MNRKHIFSALLLLLLSFACSAEAGSPWMIPENLQNDFHAAEPGEFFPVILVLSPSPDIENLSEIVRDIPRDERSAVVWQELESLSSAAWRQVVSILDSLESEGGIRNPQRIRICNGIALETNRSSIYSMLQNLPVDRVVDNRIREFEKIPSHFAEAGQPDPESIPWHVEHVHAPEIWADGYTGQGVLAAIFDTGVNYHHTDLADHLWDGDEAYPNHGYDFYENDLDPMDNSGHGTSVAGILCGDGTSGTYTGIAPDLTIMCIKVRGNLASGQVGDTWLAQDFVLERGVDLVHMSLGWGQPDSTDRPVWRNNYDILNLAGIVNVKSAGNRRGAYEPPISISVPGDVPSPWRNPDEIEAGGRSGLIAVGAIDENDFYLSSSSNGPVTWMNVPQYGDYLLGNGHQGLIKPDLCAPGSRGTTTSYLQDDGYTSFSHTSMAAPHVSGVVALMLSKDFDLLPVEIDSILQTTAIDLGLPGKDNDYGAGLVRADRAVDAVAVPMGLVQGNVSVNNLEYPYGIDIRCEQRPRRHALSDSLGEFRFELQTGHYRFQAVYMGIIQYTSDWIDVIEGDTLVLPVELDELGVDEGQIHPDLPQAPELLSLFPVPANNQISVEFRLPEASIVHLGVFDCLGRKVIMETLSGVPGVQSRSIQMEQLTSGLYFVNIEVNNQLSGTWKIIHLK